jgi:hypothetical protein
MEIMCRILIIFIFFSFLVVSCSNSIKFDSDVWKSKNSINRTSDGISERQKMLIDVLKLIHNKPKSEIIILLGSGSDSEYFKSSGRDLLYILGPERSYISIDSEWLLLWFDENNILIKYEIRTD